MRAALISITALKSSRIRSAGSRPGVGRPGSFLAQAAVIAITVALAVVGLSPARAAEDGPSIKVISYNVQFLPGIASVANKRKEPAYRAHKIGKELAEFDIVGLNEVFEEKPREMLLGELRQAWGDRFNGIVSPRVDPKRFNGGLAIASRHPFVETHVLTYSQGSSPKKYGVKADGFAAKGALHATIALGEGAHAATVDVFVTHMESKDDEIRETQYEELAQFVAEHTSPARPALMLGDFNTNAKEDAYGRMTKRYQQARAENEFSDVWTVAGQGPGGTSEQEIEDGGSRIDYIFLLNPKRTDAWRLTPRVATANRYLDAKVGALSDHNAVAATFDLAAPR